MAGSLANELETARAAQRRGSYRGSDEGKLVEVQLSGDYRLKRVRLDAEKLGISESQADLLAGAIAAAVNEASEKARRKAAARLDAALRSRERDAE